MWLDRKTKTLYLSERNVAALLTHGMKNGRPSGYLIKSPKDANGSYALMVGGNRDEVVYQDEAGVKFFIHLDEAATESLKELGSYHGEDFTVEIEMDEGHYMGTSGMDKRTYESLDTKERERWS